MEPDAFGNTFPPVSRPHSADEDLQVVDNPSEALRICVRCKNGTCSGSTQPILGRVLRISIYQLRVSSFSFCKITIPNAWEQLSPHIAS